ncbi:hypothetical protein SOV_37910 [Sporomusa ovata DSM 2662]|uniref:Uncharacterized protein n=1 Tax=Sporomusa ovata TaxID=2378 RepID=A0A0U1KUB0_9FIRM|nr:hypothetical protein [Sporomusa ovata]EQB26180.1 hypothetical protein SOV_3c00540 [Sporomusa ovata DSM 2662]CQR70254.1 hypothetical protein SpAn4DRAFT_1223 [Sporomusa ovata]
MQKMTESEIRVIAEDIVSKTSDQATTIIFQDGTTKSVMGNWLGYKNIWLVIQGKAEAEEVYDQLLLSYKEIQYCEGC